MRGGVPQDREGPGVLVRQDLDLGIGFDGLHEADRFAVHHRGERRLGQSGADGRRDLRAGRALRELKDLAVGQSDVDLVAGHGEAGFAGPLGTEESRP
jgi:hypothetical protein